MTPLIREIDPPEALFKAIQVRIARARQRSARFQLGAFGVLTFVSTLLFIQALQYAASEFYTSGFYDYASLLVDSFARGYAQDLLLSLSNSLPSLALLLLAAVGSTLVWSLRATRESARTAFTHFALPV